MCRGREFMVVNTSEFFFANFNHLAKFTEFRVISEYLLGKCGVDTVESEPSYVSLKCFRMGVSWGTFIASDSMISTYISVQVYNSR